MSQAWVSRAISACIAVAVLGLAGCGSNSTSETDAPEMSDRETNTDTGGSESGSKEPASDMVEVPWADYAPTVKKRIDRMVQRGNCDGLQAEFDNADANNDATMQRTGHNNADLMTYIDATMEEAGCY